LRGLWAIDDAKLNALDDARVIELFRAGHLRLIETHRLSLANLARLAQRLEEHAKVTGAETRPEADAA
jgi:hypothetical protein